MPRAGYRLQVSALEHRTIHGRRIAFRRAGDEGPLLLLVHGITNSSASWLGVIDGLAAAGHRVLAPDLAGHGGSGRLHGDHSMGAHACVLRDLMQLLGEEGATVVGHSLGGGVAMQFSYQFPQLLERMVLVDSGGLGREVSPLIRSATLPGAELVISLATTPPFLRTVAAAGGLLARLGVKPGADLAEVAGGVASLGEREKRAAFVRTAKAIASPTGQRVTANDRLYLAAEIPTMVIWGSEDPIIPVAHGRAAYAMVPGSRFELFPGAGHFPMLDDPARFVALLTDFVATTEPSVHDPARLRDRIVAAGAADATP